MIPRSREGHQVGSVRPYRAIIKIKKNAYLHIFSLDSQSKSPPFTSVSHHRAYDMALPLVPLFTVVAVVVIIYRLLQVGKRDPRMPNGPPTLPILGPAHQIPSTGLFKQ
jgi:hypothetical protein